MEWNDNCFDVGDFMGKWGLWWNILGKIGVSVEIEQLWLIRLEKVGFSLKYAPLFIYKITILLKNMFSAIGVL